MRLRRLLSPGFVLLGASLFAACVLVGAPEILYRLLGLSAPAITVAAILVVRPQRPRIWLLVAAGQWMIVTGDVLWALVEGAAGDVPFPSAADGLYLTAYALLAAGLVHRMQGAIRFNRVEVSLDAIIFSIGCSLVLWHWVLRPVIDRENAGLPTVVAIAYPLLDFLLLGLVIRTASRGRPVASEWLLVGGLCSLAVSDVGYVHRALTTSAPHTLADAGWLLTYLLWGAAALHPSFSKAFTRADRRLEPLAGRRIGVLVAGVVLTLAGVLGAVSVPDSLPRVMLALLGIFCVSLIARLTLVIEELRGLARTATEAEQRFRAIFEAARAGISLDRPDGTIRAVNPALGRMLGYEPDELEGVHFRELTEDLVDVEADEALLLEVMAGRRDDYRLEKLYRRKDGSTFLGSLQVSATEIDGEPGVVAIIEDLTELKDLEERLGQSHKLEAVGRLAGGIAHDFNNVLTAISGFAAVGLSRTADPDLRSTFRQIEKASERGSALTSQIFSFSRGHVATSEQLDLNVTVSEVAPLLERLLPPPLTLTLELADAPVWVLAESRQIEQMLMNLVVNARDASLPDGTVTITTATVGDQVRLAVSDKGSGMSEATRAHAFEPFFTTKPVGSGTGLGLATVYGIATQFGGEAAIQSAPGRGTTVTVLLPVAAPAAAPMARPATAAPADGALVLVAEDDEAVADVVGMLLADAGYRIELCPTGEAALAFVESGSGEVEVLLTDIRMPGIDGFELAEALLAQRPALPIVFMSGYAEIGSERAELRYGRPWLSKPFDPDELETAVATALASASQTGRAA